MQQLYVGLFRIFYDVILILQLIMEGRNNMSNQNQEVGSTRGGSVISSGSVKVQKKTYYYSKFDLFQRKNQDVAFSKYKTFLTKLIMQLGEDWRVECNLLLPQSGSRAMFESSLQIWLQINKMKKGKEIKEQDPNINYESIYFELFFKKLQFKIMKQQIVTDSHSLKQLAMGFFLSANQIWEQLAAVNRQQIPVRKGSMFSMISENIQKKSIFSPLMMVKQKIFTLFNKKVKTAESPMSIAQINNFSKFKQNLEEQQQLQNRLKRLKLHQQDQQMNQQLPQSKKRGRQMLPQVVFQKIPEQNPINQSLLHSAYRYIQDLINKKDKWQVARGFVTSILEINYNKIQQIVYGKKNNSQVSNISGSTTSSQKSGLVLESDQKDEQISIRVLKPANDFYNNLMAVWLLFRSDSDYKMKFKQYLQRVRNTFGTSWKQNYVQPTKIFFSSLGSQWNRLIQQNETLKKADEQVIEIFVERVRVNMQKQWQQKIVKKQGDFTKGNILVEQKVNNPIIKKQQNYNNSKMG